MTKKQMWDKVLELMESHSIENAEFKKELAQLLEPKKGGGASNRITVEKDGITYKSCRLTDRLWPESELIYQNDKMREVGKDKGYSKVGISLWNKGQKYIQNLKNDLTNEIMANKPDKKKLEEMKKELKEIESKKSGNNPEWILKFATEDQLKEIDEKSLPISE